MNEDKGTIERDELILISRQFAGMLDAGIDILKIIDVIRAQFSNPMAKEVLTSIERDMRLGRLLSTALGRYPEVFSPFYITMIRQGERDEALARAFNRVAEHLSQPIGTDNAPEGGLLQGPSTINAFVDRVTPIAFWLALSTAATVIAIAGLWYATNAGHFDSGSLGPNICMLVGVFILVSSLIFARLRPRQWVACSFCGRSQQVVGYMRRSPNGAICDACIESSYLAWVAQKPKPVPTEKSAPTQPQSSQPPPSHVIEEEEEEIGEEFQVVEEKEDYY
jgi:type II secretion system (T2SS) protein F/ClpX C4-type zinc finger protein